eukprot:499923-Pleurochrysis_carterae.AAC.1
MSYGETDLAVEVSRYVPPGRRACRGPHRARRACRRWQRRGVAALTTPACAASRGGSAGCAIAAATASRSPATSGVEKGRGGSPLLSYHCIRLVYYLPVDDPPVVFEISFHMKRIERAERKSKANPETVED